MFPNDILIFPKREDLPSLSEVLQSSDSWNHQKIHHRKSEQAGDKSLAHDIADHTIMIQLADHQLRQPEQSDLGGKWNRSKAPFRSTEVKPWTQLKTHAVQNRIGLQVGVVHWKTLFLSRVTRPQRIQIEVFSIEGHQLAEHSAWTKDNPMQCIWNAQTVDCWWQSKQESIREKIFRECHQR